jgi:hypothetical protein
MTASLEIHISYFCNLRCNNCSNLCAQAPDHAGVFDLSPAQLDAYLTDCLANQIHWKILRLHGGEPTLCPELFEHVAVCKKYLEATPDMGFVELLSNGNDKAVLDKLAASGVHLGVSAKDDLTRLSYVTVNDAPCDYPDRHYSEGCFQHTDCGIALNYAGFFACSPMAAAYRVGLAPEPIRSARHISDRAFQFQMSTYCRKCGFSDTGREARRTGNQVTSETWRKALAR